MTFYSYNERGDVTRARPTRWATRASYTYDTRGNTLSETDALGHVTRSTYDEQDNLLTQTDALGHTSSYTYNDRGQVLTTRDPLGHVTTNIYDTKGKSLSETRDPQGRVTRYGYKDAEDGLRTSMTDALGHVTSYI